MEILQALVNQLNFSLTTSQMIISFGILALGAIWHRMKVGVFLTLSSIAYWGYAANKAVLFEMALASVYGIFMTLFVGLFVGFLMVYAWVLPSSSSR
jgi:hypothetical protein